MLKKYPEIKSFFLIMAMLYSSSICCAAHEASKTQTKDRADMGMKIYVYNGTTLTLEETNISEIKPPVTKGLSFALFFLKDGHVPVVKVLKAEAESIRLEKVLSEKPLEAGMGFLTGVVYKPVHGGKISQHKGIQKLINDVEIEVVKSNGEKFNTTSGEDGVYGLQLSPGEYTVSMAGDKKGRVIVIEKAKTTVQNLQKGMVLRD